MVVFVVDQQDGDGDEGRYADPDQLHAVALADVEDARVGLIVDGGVDVDPPHQDQYRVDEYGNPIQTADGQTIFLVAFHSMGRRFAWFLFFRPDRDA